MNKEDIITRFDPNGPGISGNLFGFPFTPETAEVIIIPIPWEVTVSYNTGTVHGPSAILKASAQVDSFSKDIESAWKLGISMLTVPDDILQENNRLRELARQHISRMERGQKLNPEDPILQKINEACENLNIYVKSVTQKYIKEGKIVGMLGGDHSTPLGFIRALGEHHDRFGILQIDAHADLRKAYEGFTYSHASIMYNALKLPAVNRIIQVGVRDYCGEEMDVVSRSKGRVEIFFDDDLKARRYHGHTWDSICTQIIEKLPPLVYISFDIDGLDPKLCPNTGTPVPGGLEFQEAAYLIKKVVQSGRKIIGFDLCEVGAGESEFDANVGARMLYHLCNWTGVSHKKLKATT